MAQPSILNINITANEINNQFPQLNQELYDLFVDNGIDEKWLRYQEV